MKMKAKNSRLACPLCGFQRLIDTEPNNVSDLIPEKDFKSGIKYDYVQKCSRCKQQIYIRKVS